jgi:starch phosphorylase
MTTILSINVVPTLPENLRPLKELACNLWFNWHPEVADLFRRLDIRLWEETYHNPVLFLGKISQERLDEVVENEGFMTQFTQVYRDFQRYIKDKSIFDYELDRPIDFTIAYLSAEYGLAESLPFYSGGLGVLSGDHLKSASDLNLPLVAVGLLYQNGYFKQHLNIDGQQQERFKEIDFPNAPIMLEKDDEGNPIKITVPMKQREIGVQIWRVQVGRVPLYMLDSNIQDNRPEDRAITSMLYGGDREMRLRQEIILGIGGARALQRMGHSPAVYHMNEGHSAFACLERIRTLMKEQNLSFGEAFECVYASNVFTTHTPVPAGNDLFDTKMVESYLGEYVKELEVSFKDFLALGRKNYANDGDSFEMTILALKMSAQINGVSKLHTEVSRKMWNPLWQEVPNGEVPIRPITNGVHVPSWISPDMAALYDRYLSPRWIEDPDNEKVWEGVDRIPDSELWRTHERNRERLVAFARRRLREQRIRRGAPFADVKEVDEVLNPQALTIGFARRFATYKRGDLIFKDPDRLEKILSDPDRPVQIIMAGKAHPQDNPGKELIKSIFDFSKDPRFKHSIVFIENYDINVARYLVQGADVWLNTPRRPLEACGTSGMKAAANGALNLSIPDGWWCEAYDGENGWAIGRGEEYEDTILQDQLEAQAIYELLEKEVIHLFYDRSRAELPRIWITKMRNSMRTICPVFNSHRMVEEYMGACYVNGADVWKQLTENNFQRAKELAQWKQKVMSNWNKIKIRSINFVNHADVSVGTKLPVDADVVLGELSPEDVLVELYFGPLNSKQEFVTAKSIAMEPDGENSNGQYKFKGDIECNVTGKLGLQVRVRPQHDLQINPYETGKLIWN